MVKMVKLISVLYIGKSSEKLKPSKKFRAKFLPYESLPTSFTAWSSIESCVVTALEFAS